MNKRRLSHPQPTLGGMSRGLRLDASTGSFKGSVMIVVLTLIASLLAMGMSVLGGAGIAEAAPGSPGVPSAATAVYEEDFQNTPPASNTNLQSYVGTTGQTYTADPAWLDGCNGQVRSYATPYTVYGNCLRDEATSSVGQLAYALGVHNGDADPVNNNAVTAYTDGVSAGPGADKVEFQTATAVQLASSTGRYLTFSVDTAAFNCNASAPLYQFSFLNDADVETNVGSQINACDSGKTVTAPENGVNQEQTVNVGTYTSNGSLLFTGSSLGIRLRNANGSGVGNDAAFDNIRIIDATPQLDKSFSPALNRTGDISTLTFTVTNTSELASKNGWAFDDDLPAGLTLANATVGGTCDASTSAQAGETSIQVTNGNLAAGEASCTITVQVTSTTAGTYRNCPTTNVTTVGLNQPDCAEITFADPRFTISKSADKSELVEGETITYTVGDEHRHSGLFVRPTSVVY
jgi:uncharacterized repeat protein (TIGR01451 family)